MADNIDGKILDAYVEGVIHGIEIQNKEWLAWLETLIQYTDLPMVKNKIKELKKELGK